MANDVRLYESKDANYQVLVWGEEGRRKAMALFAHPTAGSFVDDARFLLAGGDPTNWSGERVDSWASRMDQLHYFRLVAYFDGNVVCHPHPPQHAARRYIFGDREARNVAQG